MPFHKYVLMKEKRNRPLCMSPEKQVASYCLLNYIYISILLMQNSCYFERYSCIMSIVRSSFTVPLHCTFKCLNRIDVYTCPSSRTCVFAFFCLYSYIRQVYALLKKIYPFLRETTTIYEGVDPLPPSCS